MGSIVSVHRSTPRAAVPVDGKNDGKSWNGGGNIIQQLPHIDWVKFDRHRNLILREYAKQLLSVEDKPEASDPTVVEQSSELSRTLRRSNPQGRHCDSSSHEGDDEGDTGGSAQYNSMSKSPLTSSRSSALQVAALRLEWSGLQTLFQYILYVASGGTVQEHQRHLSQSINNHSQGTSYLTKNASLGSNVSSGKTLHPLYKGKQALVKSAKGSVQHDILRQCGAILPGARLTPTGVEDLHNAVDDPSDPSIPSCVSALATNLTTSTLERSNFYSMGTESDAGKGKSPGAEENIEESIDFLQGLSTRVVLEQICSIAAHFNLADDDLIKLMLLPFEIAQRMLTDRIIFFGDHVNASKDVCVSSVLYPLFSSMIAPVLREIRTILHNMTSQTFAAWRKRGNSIGRNKKDRDTKNLVRTHVPKEKLTRGETARGLHLTVSENSDGSGCSNNDNNNNNNSNGKGVKMENLRTLRGKPPPIDSLHFFSEVSPRCCLPHLFQLLGEENCSVMHFAVNWRLWNTVHSLKEIGLLALENKSEVLCPLRTRFVSLRRQYMYLYDLSDTVVPLTILPLSLPSTLILDITKSPSMEILKLPLLGETFYVKRHRRETKNAPVNIATMDEVRVLDCHLCNANAAYKSPLRDSTGEVLLGVYVLRIVVDVCVHHFIFQSNFLRDVWVHRVDVARTLGTASRASLLSIRTATTITTERSVNTTLLPVNFSAFLRGRLALRFGLSAFITVRVLGTGTFGRVLLVRHSFTGGLYALKVIRKTSFASLRDVIEVRRERAILDGLNSPYLARIHATFQTTSRVYFLLDYLPGGELLHHACHSLHHHFEEHLARFFIAEVAIAVEHLRQHGIVHRDIKGENLVLDEDGHAVLTDFGFAKRILDVTGQPIRQHVCCGTLAYIAPEMLSDMGSHGYGLEVDWWSMGVVLFTLLTGFFPFMRSTRRETARAIVSQPLKFPEEPALSPEAVSLLSQLIHKNPHRRITSLHELKQHVFFRAFDWKACEQRRLPPPVRLSEYDGGKAGIIQSTGATRTTAGGTSHTYPDTHPADAAAFIEEEEHIKRAQRVCSESTDTFAFVEGDDVFGDLYEQQEKNGSERDDDDDFSYTISMDWEAHAQPHHWPTVSLASVMPVSPVAISSVMVDNGDDLVRDFNEFVHLSTTSTSALTNVNGVRESMISLRCLCSLNPQ